MTKTQHQAAVLLAEHLENMKALGTQFGVLGIFLNSMFPGLGVSVQIVPFGLGLLSRKYVKELKRAIRGERKTLPTWG